MGQILRFSDKTMKMMSRIPCSEAAADPSCDTAILADAALAIDAILAQAHESGAVDAVRVLGNLSSLLRALPR